MTPTTRLGRILLTGGDANPEPRLACRSPEDVDATLPWAITAKGGPLDPDEQQDVANLKAWLGKRQAEARR